MKKQFVTRAVLACALVLLLSTGAGAALAQSSSNAELQTVLGEMNAASTRFHSAQADFEWDQFEMVVSSTDTQKGVIYFERSGGSTRMAADIETADGQPAKKTLVYQDGELKFFQPQINQLTVFHAGKKQGQYESYLTLGFGGSGSELEKSWNITYHGMETIDGVRTAKLDLVSKSQAVRNNFTHVTIWVDPARAISLKQIFFEASGDKRTSYFRDIRYNKKIPSSVFKIKTNSKTQVIQK